MLTDLFTQDLGGLLDQIVVFLPKLVLAVTIFILTLLVSRGTSKAVRRTLTRARKDPEITLLMGQITRWGILILGTMLALDQISNNITSLITGLGITGFALGFALQDIAKNFIAGILLLLQQPFDIGDSIEVGGYGGTVKNITLRMTEICTWDGINVQIPNTDVYISPIINFTRSPLRRIHLSLRFATTDDLEKIAHIVKREIAALPQQYPQREAMIAFNQIQSGGIDMNIYFWIDTTKYSLVDVQDHAVRKLQSALTRAGISLPGPWSGLNIKTD